MLKRESLTMLLKPLWSEYVEGSNKQLSRIFIILTHKKKGAKKYLDLTWSRRGQQKTASWADELLLCGAQRTVANKRKGKMKIQKIINFNFQNSA